jgi:hypothetical protein
MQFDMSTLMNAFDYFVVSFKDCVLAVNTTVFVGAATCTLWSQRDVRDKSIEGGGDACCVRMKFYCKWNRKVGLGRELSLSEFTHPTSANRLQR